MKLSPYLSTSLAAGAFLLAGSFTLAQTTSASAARNLHPRDAASGQPSGRQAQSGSAPGTVAQRKSGSIVMHDREEDAARNSAHATESRSPSNKAETVENPLYEGGGKSGENPLYESGKRQSAGTSSNPSQSTETQTRKHLGNVKYQDRMSSGGNGVRGKTVNERGSSTAPVRRR